MNGARSTSPMQFPSRSVRWNPITLIFFSIMVCFASTPAGASGARFEVSFPAATHSQPITGRVFVFVTRHPDPEPRLQEFGDHALLFGKDVNELKAGQPVFITENTLGYPLKSLAEIPAGDYYVQGVLNVYTEFHRSDGHTIWAHMDQWEGQQFNLS